MTPDLVAIGLVVVCALSLFLFVRALSRTAVHVTWGKLPLFVLNRFLPNSGDRDTNYDYVDRRAWADLSSAEMWFKLAALCLIGVLVTRLI